MKNYSTDIAQAIEEQLEEMDMQLVSFDEEDGVFGFTASLPGEIAFLSYLIKVHENAYTVIARCPVRVASEDTSAMIAMAEFLCRCNHGLKSGNFDFNYDHGELLYKTFANCNDQSPTPDLIEETILIPSMMFMRYAPGIIGVLFRGMDPKTAVTECEKQPKVQVHLLEAAERAIRDLLKKRCNNGEMDEADNERIEQLFSMLDGMDEDMLMEEIARGFEDPDTED